jgi:hypothetical protein
MSRKKAKQMTTPSPAAESTQEPAELVASANEPSNEVEAPETPVEPEAEAATVVETPAAEVPVVETPVAQPVAETPVAPSAQADVVTLSARAEKHVRDLLTRYVPASKVDENLVAALAGVRANKLVLIAKKPAQVVVLDTPFASNTFRAAAANVPYLACVNRALVLARHSNG